MPTLFGVFIVVLVLQLVAVAWFTKGFFLTRTSLSHKSVCPLPSEAFDSEPMDPSHEKNMPSNCCPKAEFKRLVLVIVDALRYDFVLHNPNITNPLPFQNRLPIIQSTLQANPRSSYLYQFAADPPTTTMQRIKGLTTGGMPTFIDVANNFDPSDAITEDSWLHQLKYASTSLITSSC